MRYTEAAALAKTIERDLVKWRRHLHQIPETGLSLPHTRAYLKDELLTLGPRCRIVELNGGIMAEIEPEGRAKPGDTPLLLRFDMDALPVQEETGLDFSSRFPGCMHACGHDGHTAVGLGLAKILTANPGIQRNRLRIIFQAGEETLEGASHLISEIGYGTEGGYSIRSSSCSDMALAMHLDPQLPQGTVALKSGQLNARVDNIRTVFTGRQGHGAYPHLCADPVVAMAAFVTAAQTIISRNLSPDQPAVISFGKVAGGSAPNVIPKEVVLEGTLRSGGPDTAALVSERLKQMSAGIGQSFGVKVHTDIEEKCPAVLCDPGLAQWAKGLLQAGLGPEKVLSIDRILMGGDDFAYFCRVMPALMIRFGTGSDGKGPVYALHSSRFNFDEKVLVLAAAVFLHLIASAGGIRR